MLSSQASFSLAAPSDDIGKSCFWVSVMIDLSDLQLETARTHQQQTTHEPPRGHKLHAQRSGWVEDQRREFEQGLESHIMRAPIGLSKRTLTFGRERLKASVESWFTAHGQDPREAVNCSHERKNHNGSAANGRRGARLSHCVMSRYCSCGAEWMNWKTEASEILYSPTIRSVCGHASQARDTNASDLDCVSRQTWKVTVVVGSESGEKNSSGLQEASHH